MCRARGDPLACDIQWAAKHWALAAEQIELLYGERWRQFEPLEDMERLDILRAAVGYALGDDVLGLNRFREKFAAKMGDGPDRRAFDVLTAPAAASDAEFGDVARALRAAIRWSLLAGSARALSRPRHAAGVASTCGDRGPHGASG